MPAGIVKTPNAVRAKDANATKSADRNGNGSETGSGGKKFVQTRLPFKLITPVARGGATTAATSAAASVIVDLDAEPAGQELRKRKLSYGEAATETETEMKTDTDTETEQLRRSNSKENLKLAQPIAASKKARTADQGLAEDVIELDDDDDVDEDEPEAEQEKEKEKEVLVAAAKRVRKVKEKPAESAHQSAPVQIKLPLGNKRAKRRKSLKKAEDAPVAKVKVTPATDDSSDDIEAIAESLNPQKRPKVIEVAEKKLEPEPEPELERDVQAKEEDEDAMDVDSDVALLDSSDSDQKAEQAKEQQEDESMLEDDKPEKADVQEHKSGGAAEKLQNLTPKQQRLLEQRRKAREEKERKLQEERRLKQLEKEQREQLKKTEREQKEEQRRKEREDKEELRRKEREDKEELRRKEREEKERKRQADVDTKNEEKRKRNEAREEAQRKKDDERRRKELEKEEAEQKKKRAAESFTKFFVPKQPKQPVAGMPDHEQNSCDSGPSQSGSQTLAFRPFQVKDDMILAPVIRATLGHETRQQLDTLFHDQAEQAQLDVSLEREQLYVGQLTLGRHKPLRSKRDIRLQRCTKDEEDDDDVQVIDELANAGTPILEERPKQLPWTRAKYLHFADNRRPPYYGTWRKRSQLISARRPLGQDKSYFDYEVDSDCEWEEEEPGESLSASEDEKERESEEESEEEYNEWFVPHGHLSDEELQNDGELEDGNTREAQKAKLQVLQQEFAQEMKKQTKKIKPRLLGPVWLDEDGNKSQLCPAVFIQTIDMYGAWQLQPLTLSPPPEPLYEEEPPEEVKLKPTTLQLDEQLLQQLVRLIHGNRNAKVFLIAEYLEFLKRHIGEEAQATLLLPSKTLLREKFDELASWRPVEVASSGADAKKSKKPKKRLCWVVSADMLHKYHLDELTLQNQWQYTLTPKISKADTSLSEATEASEAGGTPRPDNSSKPEEATPATPTPTTTTTPAAKKRGTLLMSVPRDQQFHVATKNALISQFLRKPNDEKEKKKTPASSNSEDVVLLSD